MSNDLAIDIATAIKTTNAELEESRQIIRELANELADVVDVIEPVLANHTHRIRQARMTSVDEMRQVTAQIKELREVLLGDSIELMLGRAERFLSLCRELEEFRAVGFLDAFVELFVTAPSLTGR